MDVATFERRRNRLKENMLKYNKEPLAVALTMTTKSSKLSAEDTKVTSEEEKNPPCKPQLVEDVVIYIFDFFSREEKWNLYLDAIERRDVTMMKLLLKRNVRQLGGRYRGPYGHRLSSNVLIHSIEEGNNFVLQEVLKWYPDANRYDLRAGTALSLAASRNLIPLVETLMNNPGIDINAQFRQSDTALMKACELNHIDVVRLLLNDPRIDVNAQNSQGHTALRAAAINDRIDIFNILINRSDLNINLKSADGNTLLMTCAAHNKIEVLKRLLQHPDHDVNDVNDNLETALCRAVRRGNAQVVGILLKQPDLDMTYHNLFGQNIMDIANAAYKCPESIKEMLRRRMYTAPRTGVKYSDHYSSAVASAVAVAKYRNSISSKEGREPNPDFTHQTPYSIVAADAAIVAQHRYEYEKAAAEEEEEEIVDYVEFARHDSKYTTVFAAAAAKAKEWTKKWNNDEKES